MKTLEQIIIEVLPDSFDVIEERMFWEDEDGTKHDVLSGFCAYEDGKLISIDGDSYNLKDLYEDNYRLDDWGGDIHLTVYLA